MVSKVVAKGEHEHVDIRSERIRRGWSAKYVAKQIGVSSVSIYNIETGKKKPSLSTYRKLMSLFGHEVPRLVFGESGGASSPNEILPQENAGAKT